VDKAYLAKTGLSGRKDPFKALETYILRRSASGAPSFLMFHVLAFFYSVSNGAYHDDEVNKYDAHAHKTLGSGVHSVMDKFGYHGSLLC
jgi:hypothetical protein